MRAEHVRGVSKRFREAITQRLWDQWNAIGVQGYSAQTSPVTWAVDPEALILASSRFYRYEPRLRDIALWWVLSHSGFVSIARLKRMQEEYGFGDANEMADFASRLLATNPSLRSWQSIAGWKTDAVVREIAPFQRREMVRERTFLSSTEQILRFRALFGVTSRVEILIWLFRGGASVRELASDTVWYQKTVQKALNEMILSSYVKQFFSSSPSKEFTIEKKLWVPFFNENFTSDMVVGQQYLYSGVFEIMESLEACEYDAPSERATDFLMLESLRKAYSGFQRARISGEIRSPSPNSIEEAVENLVKDAESGESWPGESFKFDPGALRLE